MKTIHGADPSYPTAGVPGVPIDEGFTSGVLSQLATGRKPCETAEDSAMVAALCAAALGPELATLRDHVGRLRAAGMGTERLMRELLPGAARRFGALWSDSRMPFTEVAHGCGQIQRLVREIGRDHAQCGRRADRPEGRALLALAPGEVHSLGLLIAAEDFRRAGWTVDYVLTGGLPAVLDRAREGVFDLVGVSAGSRARIQALREAVTALREALPVGTPCVVGGPIVTLEPDIAAMVGADLATASVDEAIERFRLGLVVP